MQNITNILPSALPANLTGSFAQPRGASSNDQLDQTAFLRLMTTQLKTQDPFDPLDNNAMVAQFAQFSQVAGISEMNASLKAISASVGGSRIGDAASWIGHHVLIPGNIAAPDANGQFAGEFHLDADATDLSIDLLDQNGRIVQDISLGAQEAGPIAFNWDARGPDGRPLPLGPLKVRVNGGAISDLATWTTVEAVQSPGDSTQAQLITPLGKFSPDATMRLAA
ncbi:MAG: flagellar hook capping FlgD N-terminal domain-containing protein [Parasphingorhabdus sp.]|nr:flagellar hook capping FlgD N-terminal domain-containing protein [Parasphingorhabdus sp.]